MDRVDQMKQVQSTALELFRKKNIDYGDAFAKFGVIGVLMRIEDKIQRSLSITKNGVNLINDEGINEAYIIYKSINYINCYKFYYYAKCNSKIENKNSNNINNNTIDSYFMEWLPIEKEKLIEIFMKNLKLH